MLNTYPLNDGRIAMDTVNLCDNSISSEDPIYYRSGEDYFETVPVAGNGFSLPRARIARSVTSVLRTETIDMGLCAMLALSAKSYLKSATLHNTYLMTTTDSYVPS